MPFYYYHYCILLAWYLWKLKWKMKKIIIMSNIDIPKGNPCSPSPCGPNSICRENNGQPVCSCVAGFLGVPPACRPECTVSSECLLTEACSNQKCINPCLGACGIQATCQVINHNPICSCGELTGDPFIRCFPRRKNLNFLKESQNPSENIIVDVLTIPMRINSICKLKKKIFYLYFKFYNAMCFCNKLIKNKIDLIKYSIGI